MWTEETKARLADDADWWDRLDDGTKADLRAALAEIGRLSAERDRLADRLASEGASAAAEIERLKREQDAMVEEGVAPLIEALRERAEAAEAEVERLREALGRVLTEAGLQAHKHGCANKIARPAQWDARLPCAGCQAESALQGR